MNKAELIATVAEKTGLSKKDSEKAVNATFDTITANLEVGEKVQLVGFGVFDSSVSGGYHCCISCKISCCYLRLTRLPFCFSCLHFFIRNLDLQFQFRNVDADDITFLNKCDRAADCCFR